MNKVITTTAKVLAGVGALNWGLAVFNFNLLSWVPAGMFTTVVELAIGASGAIVLWLLYDHKLG